MFHTGVKNNLSGFTFLYFLLSLILNHLTRTSYHVFRVISFFRLLYISIKSFLHMTSKMAPNILAVGHKVHLLYCSSSLTSSLVIGCRSPSVNVSSGCSTTSWARGRCTSAALAGRSRESSRRPRTTSPSGKMSEVSLRDSPTPRTSSYNSRRWS